MRKKLFAAIIVSLILVLSSVVPVFAGPGVGGGIGTFPPLKPTSIPMCVPHINCCTLDAEDYRY